MAEPVGSRDVVRVMLVDPHHLFRSGLRRLLEGEPDLEVIADVARGDEAVERAAELRPDVVVMDVNTAGMSGVEATRGVLNASPGSAVLILTTSDSEADVVEAVLAGASGYLLKEATLPEIIAAIRATGGGQSIIAPRVAGGLLARLRQHVDQQQGPSPHDLSKRELDVLRLLVEGCDTAEIGERLQLSLGTVKNHVSRVLEKLDVENRVQAVVLAVRQGLVDDPEVDVDAG